MASTAPSGDAGAGKPPESPPGNPTGPDPLTNPHRDEDSPAPTSAVATPSGDADTSAMGMTEVAYPPPLRSGETRPCRSSACKKRPLSAVEERGYRECDVREMLMRHKRGGPRLPAAGYGAATRVRDTLTKMMPPDERRGPRVDYSKLTPLVGWREPSSSDDKVPQIVVVQPKGLHEGCPAQRFALQLSTEFIRLLNPQAGSSAAAGDDLKGRLDDEAIDNLLNEEGMEVILKTSIPTIYSKEILYEILMECVGRYPKWLEDNKDKVVKEKYEQYQKQLQLMVPLTLVYDKEPENLSKIMKLMYKIGEYGPPPSGIINAISPRLYQSTMEQLTTAGVVDISHDKVPQVIKVQTKGVHEGCSAQRLVGHGQVSTEVMRLLDPEVGSGTAAGSDLEGKPLQDAIENLLNGKGMQDIVKTSIPKVYSKQVLYELITGCVGQYPKWLEDNKDKLDKENHEQYMRQLEFMVNLTTVYEEEPENFSKIMKLMYKIGKYGPLPSGVIHAVSQSTMEQLSTGMVELLQNLGKLFPVDTSPSTTSK